jgi:hypothetical protein
MFACRLNETESKALESFLALAEDDGSQSIQFRSILLELQGYLERDYLGHLSFDAERAYTRTVPVKAHKEHETRHKPDAFDRALDRIYAQHHY